MMTEFITNKGYALLSKMLSGECKIYFTRVEMGNGTPIESDYKKMIALAAPVCSIDVESVNVDTDKTVDITAVFTNAEIASAFYFKEKGVFASDGKNEVLFAYAYTRDPDLIPAHTEAYMEKKLKSIIKQLQDTSVPLNIQVKSGIYVAKEDYKIDKELTKKQINEINEVTQEDRAELESHASDIAGLKNIKIGGRNYASGSTHKWQKKAFASTSDIGTSWTQQSNSSIRLSHIDLLDVAGEICISFNERFKVFIFEFNDNGYLKIFSGWQTTSPYKFKTNEKTTKIGIAIGKADDSTISLDDIPDVKLMVEKGNAPTDYTHALEDIERYEKRITPTTGTNGEFSLGLDYGKYMIDAVLCVSHVNVICTPFITSDGWSAKAMNMSDLSAKKSSAVTIYVSYHAR